MQARQWLVPRCLPLPHYAMDDGEEGIEAGLADSSPQIDKKAFPLLRRRGVREAGISAIMAGTAPGPSRGRARCRAPQPRRAS